MNVRVTSHGKTEKKINKSPFNYRSIPSHCMTSQCDLFFEIRPTLTVNHAVCRPLYMDVRCFAVTLFEGGDDKVQIEQTFDKPSR